MCKLDEQQYMPVRYCARGPVVFHRTIIELVSSDYDEWSQVFWEQQAVLFCVHLNDKNIEISGQTGYGGQDTPRIGNAACKSHSTLHVWPADEV